MRIKTIEKLYRGYSIELCM